MRWDNIIMKTVVLQRSPGLQLSRCQIPNKQTNILSVKIKTVMWKWLFSLTVNRYLSKYLHYDFIILYNPSRFRGRICRLIALTKTWHVGKYVTAPRINFKIMCQKYICLLVESGNVTQTNRTATVVNILAQAGHHSSPMCSEREGWARRVHLITLYDLTIIPHHHIDTHKLFSHLCKRPPRSQQQVRARLKPQITQQTVCKLKDLEHSYCTPRKLLVCLCSCRRRFLAEKACSGAFNTKSSCIFPAAIV